MSRKLITKIVLRNDTTQNWAIVADTMILLRGEVGLEYTDAGVKMKIGDGISTWRQLPYFISESGAELPNSFTWADLLGVVPEGELSFTQNLNLAKPGLGDIVDIQVLNTNADIIEAAIVDLDEKIINSISRIDNKITEIQNSLTNCEERIIALENRQPADGDVVIPEELLIPLREDISALQKRVLELENKTPDLSEIENSLERLVNQINIIEQNYITKKELTSVKESFQKDIAAISNTFVTKEDLTSVKEIVYDNSHRIEEINKQAQELSNHIDTLRNENTAIFEEISNSIVAIDEKVEVYDEKIASVEEVAAGVSQYDERIAQSEALVAEQEQRVNDNESRLNTLIQYVTDNGTFDGGEIIDARTSSSGIAYDTLGAHVRAIGDEVEYIKENTAELVGGKLVDGLSYENYMLQLTANGVPVGNAIEIRGGSGGGNVNSYNIELTNLLDSRIISIAKGEPAILSFKYISTDNDGFNDGNGIGTLYVNEIRKVTFSVSQGDNDYEITNYLNNGTNTVKLTVENSEGAYKTIVYTVTVIALNITTTASTMDLYTGNISFPYVLTGNGAKTVHFFMDEYEMGTEVITATESSRTFNIPAQVDGAHILTVYAEVENEGILIRSNELKMGMMFYSTTMTDQAVLINYHNLEATQGETLTIPYMCYDPFTQIMDIALNIYDESGILYNTSTITIDQTPKTWVTQDYPVGKTRFEIVCGNATESIVVNVAASSFDKEILTDSMVLEFTAAGRSNDEPNPEHWSQNDYEASFSGFGWSGADGWVEDQNGQTVLRFLPGNEMTIPYMPFAADFRNSGYTIEAEFATHNVRDYETIIATSYSGERGFQIRSQSALLASEQSIVSTQFREDTKVRVTFVVEQKNLNRFIYTYINGVMCDVVQYPESDNFGQSSPVGLTIGADACGLDLYVLRFYNKGLTRHEQLNNFICDRATLADREEANKRNDILDENGNITIATLPMTIPYMILECEELPQYKGDKKKNKSVTFVDPMHPERNFTAAGVQLDVQGTSSAGYPIKNYKVALKSGLTYTNSNEYSDGFAMPDNDLLCETFCLKADFASSENANNVMLVDYYEGLVPYKTPAQLIDDRVRTGIRGFAGVVFWHNTETNEVSFIGKYNINDDKSNENVFGFNRDVYPKCECWEFCNNTSNRVIFKESDYEEMVTVTNPDGSTETYPAWYDDFEARFPDLDDPYRDYTQLKRVTDWIVSTDREAVETIEEKQERLNKFKNEFEQYFIKDACIFYYLFTECFLMVDNRAKNVFLTTFDGDHWFPIPYDFDTSLGINNEGALVFDYNLEDTDTVGGEDVYNGQHSVLWCNVRDAFGAEIAEMYKTLRSKTEGTRFSYEALYNKMNEHQSIWPEVIWNEDAYNKYLKPFLLKNENYLEMLQGDKKAQRDWWLYNGFKYRDSKYQTGDAMTNYITLRCYNTGNITITPYSHIWPHIKFGSVDVYQRGYKDEAYEMICPLDKMNDTEVYIRSADRIADVGDLSHLQVGLAEFSAATKLQRIILGSGDEGYVNNNLYQLTVGNNELLTLIDVQNCANSKFTGFDASGCHGLETVLAKGTKLTGISLPNGGHLHTLELPATLANLTIQNQKNIEEFVIEGQEQLTTLRIENTPHIPIEELINNSPKLDRVRLMGVEWNATNEESLRTSFEKLKTCVGMDAIGNNTALAVVNGRVHISEISESFLEELNDIFPELIVVVNGVAKFFMRYVNYDNTLLYRYVINAGENAIDPISNGYIEAPARENTEDATYNFVGWSELPYNVQKPYTIVAKFTGEFRIDFCDLSGNVLNSQWVKQNKDAIEPVVNALIEKPTKPSTKKFDYMFSGWDRDFTNVTMPLVLKPLFEEILRSYKVFFYNDNTILQESVVLYGSTATYVGDTTAIKKMIGGEESIYYEFTGWSPNPDIPIEGNMNYYAQFAFDGYINDSWTAIAAAAASGDLSKYGLGGRKELTFSLNGVDYTTVELEIVGKNHDRLVSPNPSYNNGADTASLTFICKTLCNEARVMNDTVHKVEGTEQAGLNVGGWEKTDLRIWMQNTLFSALPDELKQNIKPIIKKCDNGFHQKQLIETTETVWLPSDRELNCEIATLVLLGQGEPYPVYTNAQSRQKQNIGGGLKLYWTRSSGIEGQHFYRYIDAGGYPSNQGAASQKYGIAFGFCI